jgi:hypothetical protein
MESDEKLKERALLLMRFYRMDDIYKIGKELNIPYFNKFTNCWEIDRYEGALEISKSMTDDGLLRFVEKHRPKYRLDLGGFQGNHYSANEGGEVTLSSSWNQVRENVQTVLNKSWGGEKGYGLLQAIINKGGRASYFDLTGEIEEVLGYEFAPSYLLPRMKHFKLVFKTGSNKYPDWTMPSEIIPAVQLQLKGYRRLEKPPRVRRSVDSKVIAVESAMEAILNKIVENRRALDIAFKSRFRTELFQQSESAVIDIRKPCSDEQDFNNRILSLSILIDGLQIGPIKELVKACEPHKGSINVLEAFLKEQLPGYDEQIVTTLRMIKTLRSKKYPIHPDRPELNKALRYFGFAKFPPDWQRLWEVVLGKYLESLEKLRELMQE